MRSTCIKQISSLGAVLPYDNKVPSPPKIIPIVFLSSHLGLELRSQLSDSSFVSSLFDSIPDSVIELVFIRRNYDGSELYYLVTYLTLTELLQLQNFIKEQKGGILL